MDGSNVPLEYASTPSRWIQLQVYLFVKEQKEEQVSRAEIGAIGMLHI